MNCLYKLSDLASQIITYIQYLTTTQLLCFLNLFALYQIQVIRHFFPLVALVIGTVTTSVLVITATNTKPVKFDLETAGIFQTI